MLVTELLDLPACPAGGGDVAPIPETTPSEEERWPRDKYPSLWMGSREYAAYKMRELALQKAIALFTERPDGLGELRRVLRDRIAESLTDHIVDIVLGALEGLHG